MKFKKVFIFGYGDRGRLVVRGMNKQQMRVTIIESDSSKYQQAKDDGYLDVLLVDVMTDSQLSELHIADEDRIVCVMDDEHLNVFLTLSLRSLYAKATIYSISNSLDSNQKLKMAGANRVIDLYEVSAKRIHNIIDRPIATKLLDGFLSTTSKISFKEISIPLDSPLAGVPADKINYRVYGILPIGISNAQNSASFSFATSFDKKVIGSGDTLICMGEDDDLERFEQKIEKMEHIKWK